MYLAVLGGIDEDLTSVRGTMSLGRVSLPPEMTAGSGAVESAGVPAAVSERIVRALDRSPSCVVTLLDPDLTIRWLSQSARWVTGSDPSTRTGDNSLARIHPDDVERLVSGLDVLRAASPTHAPTVPVVGPVRYRFQRFDDGREQDRLSIHPGRFHRDQGHVGVLQPLTQGPELRSRGPKPFLRGHEAACPLP